MVKKEINHFLGKDVVNETLSNVKKLEFEINKIKEQLDDISDAIGSRKDDKKICDRLYHIQKNTEISQEFLSNEYVALYGRTKTKKIKILICGFYGAKNVGDELMLEAILKILSEKNLDITILLSNNYDLDASEYAPYNILHYPKYSSDIVAIAKNYDVIIWGGGAMLDDVEYEYRGQYSTMSYIMMAISKATLKCGGQVFVYGVSSNNEIHDKKFIRDLNYIIENSDYFSLRDTNSLMTLKNAGVRIDGVEIIDDLSIYNLGSVQIREKDKKEEEITRVGVNLILAEDKIMESRKIISNIVKNFNKPIEIIFIPFYNYNDHDQMLLKKIIDGMENKDLNYKIIEQPNNIEELLDIYEKCDYLFVMRYHAALIAALTHRRVAMIDYKDQHRHYLNKNSYIKTKYVPDLLVISYEDFCKKDFLKSIKIIETRYCADKILKISEDIKTVVQRTLKKMKRNEDEN